MNQSHENNPASPLDLAESPVMSSGLARRRDDVLVDLHARLAARRRQRVGMRVGAGVGVVAVAISIAVGLRNLPKQPAPPEIATTPPRTPHTLHTTESPIGPPFVRAIPPAPEPFRITRITGDAGVLERLAGPQPTVRVQRLTDEQMLDALAQAGQPGLITIGGRVYLSGDLAQGTKPEPPTTPRGPSGSLPATDDHHG